MKRILNVGGGPSRELPATYVKYEQHLLDIDPNVRPDVCCDARMMTKKVRKGSYDAVYCSHTLEHFHRHEVKQVLDGFAYVLKDDGFADIMVPDLKAAFRLLANGKDIDDVWYVSPSGPITFREVLYGWEPPLRAGNPYYQHKTGFTMQSLSRVFGESGFTFAVLGEDASGNLRGVAFKHKPSKARLKGLGLCP